MFGYPNYSFPIYRNYNKPNRYSVNNSFMNTNTNNFAPHVSDNKYEKNSNCPKDDFNDNISNQCDKSSKNENNSQNEFLDIFGIKLYFDDLIIISLIFFLYTEGVTDYYLFITLILILLS